MEFPTGQTTQPPESTGAAPPPPGAPGTEKPKRARGRPPGSRSAGPLPPETPVPEGAASVEEPQKRRRRRQAMDKDAVAQQVVEAHKLIAKWTGQPKLQVDEIEARILAGAIEAVCSEFGIELSGKSGAITQAVYALFIVYGPRVPYFQEFMDRMRRKMRPGPVTVEGETATVSDLNGAAAASAGH